MIRIARCARSGRERLVAVAIMICTSAARAIGQGGPPMITDDPETPGPGKWEINIAATLEESSGRRLFGVPALDINYGVGERIQLKLEGAWLVRDDSSGTAADAGNALAGVKWRFFDEKYDVVSMSIYPQIEWNLDPRAARRGLVDRGTHLILPIEIARSFGRLELDGEIGYVAGFGAKDSYVFGTIAGWKFTDRFELMTELHGDIAIHDTSPQLTLNVGSRIEISERTSLIGSFGRDVHTPPGEHERWLAYAGLQVNL